jgi:hypothetical protein
MLGDPPCHAWLAWCSLVYVGVHPCTGRFASLDELLLNVSEFEAGMVQRGKEAVDADLLTHSS